MKKINKLPTLVLPKGRLYEGIFKLFSSKKLLLPHSDSRHYFFPQWFDDCNIFIAKPKSIPHLINSGLCEFGFCGEDLVADSDCSDKVMLLHKTNLNKISIVIASPREELPNNITKPLIVASEFPLIATKYFTEKKLPHYILPTSGSTEGYTSIGADCIVDVCETGDTIRANGLHVNDIVMDSSTSLFTHVELGDCLLPFCLQKIIE